MKSVVVEIKSIERHDPVFALGLTHLQATGRALAS